MEEGIRMWYMLIVTGWLVLISIMDIRRRRVPVWMLAAGGGWIVLILIFQFGNNEEDYINLIIRAVPGILLLLYGAATKKAGYGDGIAVLLVGMVLQNGKSLLAFGISLFLISVCSLILLTLKKIGRNTKIPYLPFLTAAWLMIAGIS